MTAPNFNGSLISRAELDVEYSGTWTASVLFVDEAPSLPDTVQLELGGVTLVGHTVRNGVSSQQRGMVVLGGPANWAQLIKARSYQADAGVRAQTVMDDLAREIGQEVASFVPSQERLGQHFVRPSTRASTVLESIIGSAQWWIDYAGKLVVGQRSTGAALKDFTLLSYDPKTATAVIQVQDLTALTVGSRLSGVGFDQEQTVRSYHVVLDQDGIVATCTLEDTQSLQAIFRALVDQQLQQSIKHLRRYRVLAMNGNTVDCQIVDKSTGYPDLVKVREWNGLAGAWCDLSPGTQVIVDWIDNTEPVIVGYVDRDGENYAVSKIIIDGDLEFDGDLVVTGSIKASGDITAKAGTPQQITLTTHTHPAPAGPTVAPTPGS